MSTTEFKLVITYYTEPNPLIYQQANGDSSRSKTKLFGNYVLGLVYLNSGFGKTMPWPDTFFLICK